MLAIRYASGRMLQGVTLRLHPGVVKARGSDPAVSIYCFDSVEVGSRRAIPQLIAANYTGTGSEIIAVFSDATGQVVDPVTLSRTGSCSRLFIDEGHLGVGASCTWLTQRVLSVKLGVQGV